MWFRAALKAAEEIWKLEVVQCLSMVPWCAFAFDPPLAATKLVQSHLERPSRHGAIGQRSSYITAPSELPLLRLAWLMFPWSKQIPRFRISHGLDKMIFEHI